MKAIILLTCLILAGCSSDGMVTITIDNSTGYRIHLHVDGAEYGSTESSLDGTTDFEVPDRSDLEATWSQPSGNHSYTTARNRASEGLYWSLP